MNRTANKTLALVAAKPGPVRMSSGGKSDLPMPVRSSGGRREATQIPAARKSVRPGLLLSPGGGRPGVPAAPPVLAMWLTQWGNGETAKPIILITTYARCPMPVCYIEGTGFAASNLASQIACGKVAVEKADADLRFMGLNDFRFDLCNLLIPMKPFDEDHYFDESDASIVAARYTPTGSGRLARFTTFTREGLYELFGESPFMRCGPALEKAMKGLDSK